MDKSAGGRLNRRSDGCKWRELNYPPSQKKKKKKKEELGIVNYEFLNMKSHRSRVKLKVKAKKKREDLWYITFPLKKYWNFTVCVIRCTVTYFPVSQNKLKKIELRKRKVKQNKRVKSIPENHDSICVMPWYLK